MPPTAIVYAKYPSAQVREVLDLLCVKVVNCTRRSELLARLNADECEPDLVIIQSPEAALTINSIRRQGLDVPTIAVLKGYDTEIAYQLYASGIDEILLADEVLKLFAAKITKVLLRPPRQLRKLYLCEHFLLDELHRTVVAIKNRREIELRPREFWILSMLARSRGRSISREQIVSPLLSSGRPLTIASIDVHISNMRKRFLDAAGVDPIITVNRHGYLVN